MRRVSCVAVLAALLLAGCAPKPWDARWTRPNATLDAFERARAACLDEATVPDRIGGYRTITTDPILFRACMQRLGWRELPDDPSDRLPEG